MVIDNHIFLIDAGTVTEVEVCFLLDLLGCIFIILAVAVTKVAEYIILEGSGGIFRRRQLWHPAPKRHRPRFMLLLLLQPTLLLQYRLRGVWEQ